MRHLQEVPPELLARAATQCGLVSAGDCATYAVGPARRASLVDARIWTRLTRGVYDTRPGDLHRLRPGQRACRAAWAGLLAYGPDCVAVASSACALLGIEGLPLGIAPETALPGGRSVRGRDGLVLRQYDAGLRVVRVGERFVAAPEWALAQTVPRLGRDRAVAIMDSALHRGLLDLDGLATAHELARGRRGVHRTHAWWSLAREGSESPLETFGRLDCHDVGVPPDELQVPILDDRGNRLGRGDAGWRLDAGRWLVAEMDGEEVHSDPAALLHDRSRQNDFLVRGNADVLRFTYRDLGPAHRIGRTVKAYLESH